MRLVYIANAKMPHNRARSIQIAKMSEAYNRNLDTTLIAPLKLDSSREKTYNSYGIESRFKIKYAPSIDLVFLNLGILPFYLQSVSFSFLAVLSSLFMKKDYYYTRDIFTSFFLCLLRPIHRAKVFYECHNEPTKFEKPITSWTFKRLNGVAFVNENVKANYLHFNKKHVMAPDGVDVDQFSINVDKDELKKKLNLENKKIVLYSGHFYKWKGIYTLLDSTKYWPDNLALCILGGTPEDTARVKEYIEANKISNATFLGYVDYTEVPEYVASADILVLPNSSRDKFSHSYTSPLKLFEYMASGNPVVASNLPSIRQVLNENNAVLVAPDDPIALAEGIKKAVKKETAKLASKAKEDVLAYSWTERAGRVLKLMAES